jgi:hypothetical protein
VKLSSGYKHSTGDMMSLDSVLVEQKETRLSIESIKAGVAELDFECEAFVAFTVENRLKFREDGRSFQDIEEWRDTCASGQTAPIIPDNNKSNIVTLWCFENAGDAFMFKLTFCAS